MTQFYATATARTYGTNAIVMSANGLSWAYHVEEAARQAAMIERLPGFWRLKERKA